MRFWLAVLFICLPVWAMAAPVSPEATVKAFYDMHIARIAANQPGVFGDKALCEEFFSTDMAERIQAADEKPDFDPVFDAQDSNVTSVTTRVLNEAYEVADVEVAFRNFDKAARLVFSLTREDGTWRINDIASPKNGWRLQELYPGP